MESILSSPRSTKWSEVQIGCDISIDHKEDLLFNVYLEDGSRAGVSRTLNACDCDGMHVAVSSIQIANRDANDDTATTPQYCTNLPFRQ